MIRWDAMHTVNLGVDLWITASAVRKVLEYDVWGGLQMPESDRLLVAFDLFKTWSRAKKVWYLGPKTTHFCSKQFEWQYVIFLIKYSRLKMLSTSCFQKT